MPNIKSAKKRVKVIETKTLRNKMVKSNLKTIRKNANIAIENKADDKEQLVTLANKRTDMAASKGIIHKNKAARMKSQLAKKLNSAK